MSTAIPAVLVFSGLDPGGGAGIQADIEALASHGCHTCPVITTLTVQDTHGIHSQMAISPAFIQQQADILLQDIQVSAIKIGLVDNSEIIETIAHILRAMPDVPVIFDPVLSSGGSGRSTSDAQTMQAMKQHLLPLTTVLTPNSVEARQLSPDADTLDACAYSLLDQGCEFILLTGTHEPGDQVCHHLYSNHRKLESFSWPRLPGEFHGSGCTLAASIAGLLAQGNEPMSAIHQAQEYTWHSLQHAYEIGKGQSIPNRLFWATGH